MALFTYKRSVRALTPPADGLSAGLSFLTAVKAPECGTDNTVLGPKDVNHVVTLVNEGVHGEDLCSHYANRLRLALVDGCLRDEGRNQTFGEYVQGVDQERWHLVVFGVGDVLRGKCEKLPHINRWLSD